MLIDITSDQGWLDWLFAENSSCVDENISASHSVILCASCSRPITGLIEGKNSQGDTIYEDDKFTAVRIDGVFYHSNVLECVEWSMKTGGIGGHYGKEK